MRKFLFTLLALMGLVAVQAQCPPPAPLSTPLLESWTTQPNNLIGTAAGTVAPNCWTLTSGAVAAFHWRSDQTTGANRFSTGTGPWFDNTQYGVAGGLYLFLETSSGVAGDSAFVVSPDINISNLTNPELRFFYHMYGATTGSMVAQVWNGSAWVTELTITGQQQTAGNAPWLEGVVSLAGYPSTIKVRIKGIRGTSFTGDMALDDISVAEAPACPNPTAPSVLSVSFNSANLNWNVGDINATSWQIEYGAPGFTPGTGTIVSGVNSVPYTLTGLSANTSYAFYVSETCVNGGGQSTQVGPISFTTLCAPEVAPYTADFEGVQNLMLLDYNNCWTVPSTSTPRWRAALSTGANQFSTNTGPWYDNTNYGLPGGTFMFLITSSGIQGGVGELHSPLIDLSGLTSPYVEFYYHMYGATMGSLYLDVQDTGGSWLPLTSLSGQQHVSGSSPWLKVGVAVPAHISGIHKFRFRGERGSSFTGEMAIDDFEVMEAPACPDPSGIQISNVGGNSFDVTLNATSTNINVEWGPSGFVQGTGTVVNATGPSFTVSGLISNTQYDVYFQANCGANGNSAWVGPFTFSTTCGILNMPFTENFNAWPPSICISLAGGTQSFAQFNSNYAWANFWGWTQGNWAQMVTEPIAITQAAQVKFKWSHLYSSFYPADQLLVMVQEDVPGSPIDTILDLIGPGFTTPGAANTAPAPIFNDELVFIPTAYVGKNVKVIFRANSGFGPSLYMDDLVVEAAPSCPPPLQLQAFNIGGFQADLRWSSSGTSTGWDVEWGPVGFVQGTGTLVTSPNDTLTLTGLTPTTPYHVYVRQNCGPGQVSGWAGPLSFTTDVSCPAPSNVSLNPSTTGVAVSWSSPGNQLAQYIIDSTGVTPSTGVIQSTSGSPLNITGLTPSTPYTFWLRDSCGPGDVSTWVGPFNFNTLCVPASIPYARDFNTWPPLCWDLTGGTQTVAQNNANYLFANFWSWTQGNFALASTEPITIGTDARVRFRWSHLYNATYPLDQMILRVRLANGTTWDTLINKIGPSFTTPGAANTAPAPDANFIPEVINLNPAIYTGQDVVFQFRFNSGFGPSVYVDDFIVEPLPSCPEPTQPSAFASSTSATLSWTSGASTASTWFVEYGAPGFLPGTGTVVVANANPFTLTGLSPATNYAYRVSELCANGVDTSTSTLAVNFTTLCVTSSIPYLRDFNTWPPICWDLTGGTQTLAQANNNYLFANFWGWAQGNNSLATTEPINISTDARVKFRWSHLYSTTYPLDQMILMVRLANGTTWDTLIDKIGPSFTTPGAANTAPAPDANFIPEVVNLNPAIYTGQDVVFQFRFNSGFGPSVYVDDFIVEPLPACPEPTSLVASNATATSIDLSWANGVQTATTWYIEYGAPGFTPGTGTTVSVTTNPYTLSGLSPATSYSVRVSELCANGTDTSSSSNAAAFNTLCAPVSAPYLQTFTGITSGILGTDPPLTLANCWDLGRAPSNGVYWFTHISIGANFSSTGTGPWFDATTPTTAGGGYVFLETSSGVLGSQAPFISPEIVKSSLSAPNLSFAYHMYGATTDSLRVDIWSNGAWINNVWSEFGQQQTAGNDPWLTANVDLSSYGDTIRIRFVGRRGSSFTGDIALDDIRVDEAPACLNPTQLSTTNLTAFTADLGWTNGNVAATTWFIEYGPAGFTPGTGTSVTASANPFTLTGLSAATTYHWYIRELCDNGVDTSLQVGPAVFNTACAPVNAPYLQSFTGIQSGIIGATPPITLSNCWDLGRDGTSGTYWYTHNATGANFGSVNTGPWFDATTPTTAGGGYVFLETSSGAAGSKAPFVSPEIVITALTNPNLSFSYHMYGASIDSLRVDIFSNGVWNNNVWSIFGQQQTAGNSPWSDANVALTGYGDTIKVRFIGRRGSSFDGDMALDEIRVDEAPACPNPGQLGVSLTTTSTADLNWNNGSATASTWFVEYGPVGFTPGSGTTVVANSNPYTLTGLMPATTYQYYLRELCQNGTDTSLQVGPASFTTLCVTASIPYSRDFDAWQPVCWDLSGGTQTVAQANNDYLFANFWGWTQGNTALATTEPIFISQDARVGFRWSHLYNATYPTDQMLLMVRLASSTTWDTLIDLIGTGFNTPGAANTAPAPDASFIAETLALDPATYTGQDVVFQLRFNSGFGPNVYIDDFFVIPPAGNPNCLAPTAASASVACTSATLIWTSGSGTSFVEYGPAGFVPGSGTLMSPASSGLVISGLAYGTAYTALVYDICNGGLDTSVASVVNFSTPALPVAAFTTNITQGTVVFNASTSSGATSYAWTFGDGNTGVGVNPTHTYAANGTYQVTLTITDACGQTSQITQAVVITSIATCPQPSGLVISNLACDQVSASWSSLSGSSLLQYGPAGFTPGTGTFATATSPFAITGLMPGTAYDVWVADLCSGGSDTSMFTGPIVFTTPSGPLPSITGITFIQSLTTTTNAVGDFTATGSNVTTYSWDFGNGGTASGSSVSETYLQNATYFVTLTASNSCGSVDTIFPINIVGISLEEIELASSLQIFPNPTNGEFKVVLNGLRNSRELNFEVLDALGRVIQTRKLKGLVGSLVEESFDISHLPKGVYLIRIQSGNAVVNRRVTKN